MNKHLPAEGVFVAVFSNWTGSGDIFLAFSTGNPGAFQPKKFTKVFGLPNDEINPLFYSPLHFIRKGFPTIRRMNPTIGKILLVSPLCPQHFVTVPTLLGLLKHFTD
jgi:hypothetical protein